MLQMPPLDSISSDETRLWGHVFIVAAGLMWVTTKFAVKGVTPGQVAAAVAELSRGMSGVEVPSVIQLSAHMHRLRSKGDLKIVVDSAMVWELGGEADEGAAKAFLAVGGPLAAKRGYIAAAAARGRDAEREVPCAADLPLLHQAQQLPHVLPLDYLLQLQQDSVDEDTHRLLQLLLPAVRAVGSEEEDNSNKGESLSWPLAGDNGRVLLQHRDKYAICCNATPYNIDAAETRSASGDEVLLSIMARLLPDSKQYEPSLLDLQRVIRGMCPAVQAYLPDDDLQRLAAIAVSAARAHPEAVHISGFVDSSCDCNPCLLRFRCEAAPDPAVFLHSLQALAAQTAEERALGSLDGVVQTDQPRQLFGPLSWVFQPASWPSEALQYGVELQQLQQQRWAEELEQQQWTEQLRLQQVLEGQGQVMKALEVGYPHTSSGHENRYKASVEKQRGGRYHPYPRPQQQPQPQQQQYSCTPKQQWYWVKNFITALKLQFWRGYPGALPLLPGLSTPAAVAAAYQHSLGVQAGELKGLAMKGTEELRDIEMEDAAAGQDIQLPEAAKSAPPAAGNDVCHYSDLHKEIVSFEYECSHSSSQHWPAYLVVAGYLKRSADAYCPGLQLFIIGSQVCSGIRVGRWQPLAV
jgi:hypothetical protein